jgi:hypothetical protein
VQLNEKNGTALDFWRWAYSDLMQNITRGYVAQFIVAWSLQVDTSPNNPWLPYDVKAPNGKRIEVKSTAHLQAWKHAEGKCKPLFVLKKKRPYSDEEGLGKLPQWNADIYILSYYFWQNMETADIMNLDHWKFWVFSLGELLEVLRGKQSITAKSLERMGQKPTGYHGLREAILTK